MGTNLPTEERPTAAAERGTAAVDGWWWTARVAIVLGVAARVWGLGGQHLTFDEAFTASAARKPLGDLFSFLRYSDTHPPLDYLIRVPFAAAGDELLVRLPSALFSIAALLLIARWMRPRGAFGAFTTIAASLLPLLVLHGREARMYSVVMFLGVVAAMSAERWLIRSSTTAALGVAVPGLLAMLSHSATIPAVGAFLLLPGVRRDRDAWAFRSLLAGSFACWALLWGPSFREQASVVSSFWIPLTSVDWFETVVAALISPRSSLIHVSFGVLVLGVVALLARRDLLSRVALLAFVLPLAGIALAGLELHLLLPRAFAFGSWVIAAALGAGIEWMRSNLGARGGVLGLVLVVVLLAPSTHLTVRDGREDLVEIDELRQRLQPGDRISIGPDWFRPLLQWTFVAKEGFEVVGDEDGRFVIADRSVRPSGRTHLLDHRALPMDEQYAEGLTGCAPDFAGSSWLLRCVEER